MSDYESEALEHLARAQSFRQELADAYAARPMDHNRIGAARTGVKFELETAQVFATLANTDPAKRAIEIALANMDRDRRLAAQALDRAPGYAVPAGGYPWGDPRRAD
jgi:hypothetical protein